MIRLIFCLLCLLSVQCIAQDPEKVFYNEDDVISDEAGSLYYATGIKRDGAFVDTVRSYFTKSDKLRSIEVMNEKGQQHGFCIEYFEDGSLKSRGSYKGGSKNGLFEGFYPGGKAQFVYEYPGVVPFEEDQGLYKIVNYWDSTGTQLVSEGQGFCRCYTELFSDVTVREEGNVANRMREGKWKGYEGSELVFEEEYADGVLKEGKRFDNGATATYNKVMQMAEFPGGLPGLASYLQQNLKYPTLARRKGLEGRVLVSFVVRKTGHLEDIKVVNEMPEILEKEAVRVVTRMSQWVPARMKGRPVHSRFVLPITFRLER